MVMMAELGIPAGPIRQQIASALDLIVQVNRFPDGSRKVVRISQVDGLSQDLKGLDIRDLFEFIRSSAAADGSVSGRFARSRGSQVGRASGG